MTIREKNIAWFEKREQAIRAWEAENPAPTSVIPDSIGGFDIVERADGSGYDVGCKFVSLELLEAAVERLHELKGAKPDLSKRWKVVFIGEPCEREKYIPNITREDTGFGIEFGAGKNQTGGFATKEEAEACASSRCFPRDQYAVLPYLATKLPEKRYQVWWSAKSIQGFTQQEAGSMEGRVLYPEGGFKDKLDAEKYRKAANFRWPHITHEVREVEVYD